MTYSRRCDSFNIIRHSTIPYIYAIPMKLIKSNRRKICVRLQYNQIYNWIVYFVKFDFYFFFKCVNLFNSYWNRCLLLSTVSNHSYTFSYVHIFDMMDLYYKRHTVTFLHDSTWYIHLDLYESYSVVIIQQ